MMSITILGSILYLNMMIWMKNDAVSEHGQLPARPDQGMATDPAGARTCRYGRARRLAAGAARAGAGKRGPCPENSRRIADANLSGRSLAVVWRQQRRPVRRSVRNRDLRQLAEPARQAVALCAKPAFAAGLLPRRVDAPAGLRAGSDTAMATDRPVRRSARNADCPASARHPGSLRAETQAFP